MSRRRVVTWMFLFLFLASFFGSALLFATGSESGEGSTREGAAMARDAADPLGARVLGLEKRVGKIEQVTGAATRKVIARIDFEEILRNRKASQSTWWGRCMSLLGLFVLIGIAVCLSKHPRRIDWRLVAWGTALQLIFGLLILKTNTGQLVFDKLKDAFNVLLGFTTYGASFLFGELADPKGRLGLVFAFNILPTIIFFSSLMAVLYHLGIVQVVVKYMAKVMVATMGTSGAESLSAAANVFVGQTEAPLVVKPYIESMTISELMALMVGGMATVAGGVMAAYVGMGVSAGHLLSASVMSAPAALVMAKILVPETGDPVTKGEVKMKVETLDVNVIDAAARGAGEGLTLAMNVGGMLLAFIALVAMLNYGLGMVNRIVDPIVTPVLGFGIIPDNLEVLFGYVFAPLAWIMGVPWKDAFLVGNLLGLKVVLNEFVAYMELAKMVTAQGPYAGTAIDPRSVYIATYALCGFANFGSIAILLGGLGGMAPTRRHDLAKYGIYALIGGSLAAFMTATIAGMLL